MNKFNFSRDPENLAQHNSTYKDRMANGADQDGAGVSENLRKPTVASSERDVKNQDPEKASTSVSLEVGTHLKIMVGCFFFF